MKNIIIFLCIILPNYHLSAGPKTKKNMPTLLRNQLESQAGEMKTFPHNSATPSTSTQIEAERKTNKENILEMIHKAKKLYSNFEDICNHLDLYYQSTPRLHKKIITQINIFIQEYPGADELSPEELQNAALACIIHARIRNTETCFNLTEDLQ